MLVLGFFLFVSAGESLFLARLPGMTETSKWVIHLAGFIEFLFVIAIAVTLTLRARTPAAGQIATTALNIVLLLAFPIGTAIGIYGPWKVDELPPPPTAQ